MNRFSRFTTGLGLFSSGLCALGADDRPLEISAEKSPAYEWKWVSGNLMREPKADSAPAPAAASYNWKLVRGELVREPVTAEITPTPANAAQQPEVQALDEKEEGWRVAWRLKEGQPVPKTLEQPDEQQPSRGEVLDVKPDPFKPLRGTYFNNPRPEGDGVLPDVIDPVKPEPLFEDFNSQFYR